MRICGCKLTILHGHPKSNHIRFRSLRFWPPTLIAVHAQTVDSRITLPLTTIDYRRDNTRFWLSTWSRLTHQLLGRLKSTIPNLQIYLPKTANSEKLGLGIDNPCRTVFMSLRMNKCLERVNDRHFGNSGVFSYAIAPTQEFFHRHIYSLCWQPTWERWRRSILLQDTDAVAQILSLPVDGVLELSQAIRHCFF